MAKKEKDKRKKIKSYIDDADESTVDMVYEMVMSYQTAPLPLTPDQIKAVDKANASLKAGISFTTAEVMTAARAQFPHLFNR